MTVSLWLYKHVPGVHTCQCKLNQLTSYIPPPPSLDESRRRILLVQSHPIPTSFSSALADAFAESAIEAGQEVKRINLYQCPKRAYNPVMSEQERTHYFRNAGKDGGALDESHLAPEVQKHMQLLKWCDTLVFVYPTWWSTTPSILKGFLERTLVPGSTWDFPSDREKAGSVGLVPRLPNIQQIVGISTYGGSRTITALAGDCGRSMIANNIRHAVSPSATVTWLGLYDMDFTTDESRTMFLGQVRETAREI